MTNHWIDIRNADAVLIIGSNTAANHPIAFKYVTEAQLRGGTVISVDPRFTRTASKADIWAPLRSGTDIAFVGGMIKWVLDDMWEQLQGSGANVYTYNLDYVRQYTNAALIINSGIKLPGDTGQDGLFSGYDSSARTYAKGTWDYGTPATPASDPTLTDPLCVFQLLRSHFARYDADTVCNITGTPKDVFLQVCRAYAATGQTGKAGTILYAMGATQHTYGTQNIRAYSILQALLGNMGVAGGGINALRGESNVQGSTDFALLWHYLPGYLAAPHHLDVDVTAYLANHVPAAVTPQGLAGDKSANWWGNYKKYVVSLLAAWYGNEVQTNADACFNRLPKVKKGENYAHIRLFEKMNDGIIKGLMCWGQNPAVGGPMASFEREALHHLDWLVAVDLWETETAAFWKRPGADPATIATEVYLLPAAASFEKQGSITNSSRWVQWRYKALDPPGEAEDDLWIVDGLMLRLKQLYNADAGAPNRDAILKLAWDHGADPDKVAREINGYELATGKLVAGFANLKDDGTTSSGCWIYCDMYSDAAGNKAKRRDGTDWHPNKIGLYSNWAWAWPYNRRIIYNRASVDLDGKPWDAEHPVIAWAGPTTKWVGDVADGAWPPINASGAGARYLPFLMRNEGVARLWGPGMADGPLPEAYEPWESPLAANPMSGTKIDPTCFLGDYRGTPGSPAQYPYVATTYRVTEHWQAGQMTRNLPWLVELMPEMFVHIGVELAAAKGIASGDRVRVTSPRGEITAVAIVTPRMVRLSVNGQTIDHIGIPWHWGYAGLSTGDSANLLTPHVGDANTSIPEYKTFLCNLVKV